MHWQDIKGDNVILSFDSAGNAHAKFIDLGLMRGWSSRGAGEDANDAARMGRNQQEDAPVDAGVADQHRSRTGWFGQYQHAPELSRAAAQTFTPKADIWALASMIVHEMLYMSCHQLCTAPNLAYRTYQNCHLLEKGLPRNPLWTIQRDHSLELDPEKYCSYTRISAAMQALFAQNPGVDQRDVELFRQLCDINSAM
jgi:serine/threonine protein kinase